MDRLFDEGFSRPWRFLPGEQESFPVAVAELDEHIEVRAALPGVKPDDVDISVTNDVLTIRAEHKEQTDEKKRDYYRREIRYGAYQRAFSLPVSVEAENAEARFENGLLYLRLPKAAATRTKQIKVTGGNGS
jgi:HSP20 family protein